MAIVNNNWYSLQSTRRYPLDERATGTGDNGERLKDDILVDCQLRFPHTAGTYAYVGSVTVTPSLVTVTFLAAESPDAAGGFVPLAVLSLPQPVERHIHYALQPMLAGVAGFVVFGDVGESFSARFSSPSQSLLLPRCAAAYQSLPVRSIGKVGRGTHLTGVVGLVAGSDISITAESRLLNGEMRQALVFRLAQQVVNRNVLQNYLGPCDQRPESRTCDKDGIETINGLGPDCDGNFNIRFAGMTARAFSPCVEELPSVAGVTLDQSIGIDEICQPTQQPGRFVGHDQCVVASSSLSVSGSSSEPLLLMPSFFAAPFMAEPFIENSSMANEDSDLPLVLDFERESELPLRTVAGAFVQETIGEQTSCAAQEISRRNIALLDPVQALNVRIAAECGISHSSSQANCGLILNYRSPLQTENGYENYYSVVLDRVGGKLRLLRWTGTGLIEEHSQTAQAPIRFEDRYRLEAEVGMFRNRVTVRARASGITQPSWPSIGFSVSLGRYLPAEGRFGISTDRSLARFYNLRVETLG